MDEEKTPWDKMPTLLIVGTDYSIDIHREKLWAGTTGVGDVWLTSLEKTAEGCYFGYFDAAEECFVSKLDAPGLTERPLYAIIIPGLQELDPVNYAKMQCQEHAPSDQGNQHNTIQAFAVPVSLTAVMDAYCQYRGIERFPTLPIAEQPFATDLEKEAATRKKITDEHQQKAVQQTEKQLRPRRKKGKRL